MYKFELKSLVDVSNTSINIGNNFWSNKAQSQDHHQLGFIQSKHMLSNSLSEWGLSGAKQFRSDSSLFTTTLQPATDDFKIFDGTVISAAGSQPEPVSHLQATNGYYLKHNYALRSATTKLGPLHYKTESINLNSQEANQSNFNPEVTRLEKLSNSAYTPVRLVKSPDSNKLELNYSVSSAFTPKPESNNFYLVVKQKRYMPSNMTSNKYTLDSSNSFVKNEFRPADVRSLAQHTATRGEVMSLQSNRRLLRTRRVLVLPAHTNITLVTNSFDVMHSWYIPGLGVKLDCVPGRSTHHTIHIDHAGFYYGQCAEICGRYHHHMPIRVCALPFEHFLIWWYHYGAPFFLAGNQDRSKFIKCTAKQINW